MRKFKYEINVQFKGEVMAYDVQDAIKKAVDKYYSDKKNVESHSFQAMNLHVEEIT